ncbi:MAG: PAN domain-containing protein [Pseudomonadota bacterium]
MMRMLTPARSAFLAMLLLLPAVSDVLAQQDQNPIPDRRIITRSATDFYGGDIGSLFETTFRNCQNACMANPACKALTYNTKAEACFLKSGVERIEIFDGAVSARMIDNPLQTKALGALRAGDLGFLPDDLIRGARTLARDLGGRISSGETTAQAQRAAAIQAEQDGDLQRASRHLIAALSQADASETWRELARLWLATPTEKGSERRRFRRESLSASINAYLRAPGDPARVASLLQLAQSLEARGRGRDMISALALSQGIADRKEARDLLDYATSRYGFRVTGHSVDSDAASPRICIDFSETLAGAGVDYAPYIAVAGHADLPVEAEGSQICVEGVLHGGRYKIAVRPGLPSATAEETARAFEIETYVRDRSPSVRFVGRAYVLPRTASSAIPVVTVNTSEVALSIHRIGSRNLVNAIRRIVVRLLAHSSDSSSSVGSFAFTPMCLTKSRPRL